MQQPHDENVVHFPSRPKIKLTAQDYKVTPMSGVGSVIEGMQKPAKPMPTIQQEPNLYHVCSVHGIIEPMWASVLNRYIKRSCECVRLEREEKERQEREIAWNAWQKSNCYGGWLGETHRDDGIVSEMSRRTFDTYMPEAFPEFDQLYAYGTAERPAGNLLLCGSYGSGKTHLLAAIINYQREYHHAACLFASAPALFGAYEEAKRMVDQTQFISIRQKLVQARFLVLDDIDKEWRGDWKQAELHSIYYYIFDERYKARRPTLVSTNNQDELAKFIGAAARSRLMSKCQVYNLLSEDFRAMEEW